MTTRADVKPSIPNFHSLQLELQKFGLSEAEALVYLMLVEYNQLRIQELVKLCNIPRSSIYQIIKRLMEFGIVEETIDESHRRYRAYSIGTMHHGLDEQMLEIKRLKKDLSKLEEKLVVNQKPIDTGGTNVRYYQNRSGARQIFWNSLKTNDTVYVYSDWGRGRYVGMRFYERFVEESRIRNVKEKVLINLTPHALESIKRFSHPGSPISRTKLKDIRYIDDGVLRIKGDTLIYDHIYAQVYLKNIEINGFEIENNYFASSQRSVFKSLWQNATPITKALGL